MQKIVPYLWFDGNAAEAAAFYTAAFPGARSTLAERYPTEGLLDFQQPLAGEPLTSIPTARDTGGSRTGTG